ncbi:MAG TPA: flagellar hook-length control protein FliK [Anaerolineales bacterium]|nr:flagellar hook-length control protein FliK [Anaerolineales bacterium]
MLPPFIPETIQIVPNNSGTESTIVGDQAAPKVDSIQLNDRTLWQDVSQTTSLQNHPVLDLASTQPVPVQPIALNPENETKPQTQNTLSAKTQGEPVDQLIQSTADQKVNKTPVSSQSDFIEPIDELDAPTNANRPSSNSTPVNIPSLNANHPNTETPSQPGNKTDITEISDTSFVVTEQRKPSSEANVQPAETPSVKVPVTKEQARDDTRVVSTELFEKKESTESSKVMVKPEPSHSATVEEIPSDLDEQPDAYTSARADEVQKPPTRSSMPTLASLDKQPVRKGSNSSFTDNQTGSVFSQQDTPAKSKTAVNEQNIPSKADISPDEVEAPDKPSAPTGEQGVEEFRPLANPQTRAESTPNTFTPMPEGKPVKFAVPAQIIVPIDETSTPDRTVNNHAESAISKEMVFPSTAQSGNETDAKIVEHEVHEGPAFSNQTLSIKEDTPEAVKVTQVEAPTQNNAQAEVEQTTSELPTSANVKISEDQESAFAAKPSFIDEKEKNKPVSSEAKIESPDMVEGSEPAETPLRVETAPAEIRPEETANSPFGDEAAVSFKTEEKKSIKKIDASEPVTASNPMASNSAFVDRVENQQPTQTHAMDVEIIQQIMEPLKTRIKSGETSMRVQLNPKELGVIEVRMVRDEQGLRISFTTEHAGTAHLLELQSGQLRQSLKDAGVQLANLNISQHNQPRQEGGSFRQEPQFVESSRRSIPQNGMTGDERMRQQGMTGTHEVDYLI